MSVTTFVSPPAAPHYRLGDVVRSERTKFLSLRSTRWILAAFPVAAVVLGMVIGAATGAHWPHMSASSRAHWDPTNNILAGLIPGYIVLPVLGVLMMSSEYSSGSIRSTLVAVPRREMVLVRRLYRTGTLLTAAFTADASASTRADNGKSEGASIV